MMMGWAWWNYWYDSEPCGRGYTRMYCTPCDKVFYTTKYKCPICNQEMKSSYGRMDLINRKAILVDNIRYKKVKNIKGLRLTFHRLLGLHKYGVREHPYRCAICGCTTDIIKDGDTIVQLGLRH